MQIGQVVDFVISYNERNKEATDTKKKKSRPTKRKATQAEIDAFLG